MCKCFAKYFKKDKLNIMKYEICGNDIVLRDVSCFSLEDTFECGQCFRWDRIEGEEDTTYEGVAFGKLLRLCQKQNGDIVLLETSENDYKEIWEDYFDLKTDYDMVRDNLSKDETLKKACSYGSGIRLLRQDGWEALFSFIISQNNNIKRIKGIIKRLCEKYGEEIEKGYYAFPSAESLKHVSADEFFELKCGFRAKYLFDCVQKVLTKELELSSLYSLPLDEARESLIKIKGVGAKVADCALLYGFGRMECFPKDVWIKRAMENLFPEGLPSCAKDYAGIAQQYIFHYARTSGIFD